MYNQKEIDKRIKLLRQLQKQLQIEINNDFKLIEVDLIPQIIKSEKNSNTYNKLWSKAHIEEFHNKIRTQVEHIPNSDGSKYYDKLDINIGIISDEFLYNSFKDIANFYYITNKNYKEYASKIDLLLVVSTWRGLNNEWRGLANSKSNRRRELHSIISDCKQNNIKVVFYSKEDPVNYDRFIGLARDCDYIFTTAQEKIANYQKDCNNKNVFQLSFGVNPLYHNPIGLKFEPIKNEVLFTGSWMDKYPNRKIETQILFDGSIDAGKQLVIVDRNYLLNEKSYQFPEKYHPFVHPAVPHDLLQKYHKLFKYAINLNSVQYSETMFANRIYELQALGNILISNYSVGVNNLFPNVFIISEKDEISNIINGMGEKELYNHRINGIRGVMSNHTTFHRIAYILDKIGMNASFKKRNVAVIVDKITKETVANFSRQTYEHKTLFLDSEFTKEIYDDFDMFTYFSEDNYYGMNYLEDMVNGFVYTNSDFITKDTYYSGGELIKGVEFDYVNRYQDKYNTIFWSDSYNYVQNNVELASDKKGFAIDRLNFCNNHIVQIQNETSLKLSIIVPIYNNGYFLENKCFPSLLRSSMFNEMEILLIDDGSSDVPTVNIIKKLDEKYNNVKTFFFNDSGSGSASRPRNKGMEIATTNYITFLDPDNEAVNDGYTLLYNELSKSKETDIVIGNMIKFDNKKKSNFNYYRTVLDTVGSNIIEDPKDLLKQTDMRAQSIQALIFRKNLTEKNKLQMVQGAIGQDTLFFQELLMASKKAQVINKTIHIYYAAVTGSMTNRIDISFFEKYSVLERERIRFLQKAGLLNAYMNKRFNFYFKHWYLKRVPLLESSDIEEALSILSDIYRIYKGYIQHPDPEIIRFWQNVTDGKINEIISQCKKY